MGKLEAFTISGLHLWFNSNDHLPPHFHAEKPGNWEIRVFFLLCTTRRLEFTMKWPPRALGPSASERRQIRALAVAHAVDLLREWESKVCMNEEGP